MIFFCVGKLNSVLINKDSYATFFAAMVSGKVHVSIVSPSSEQTDEGLTVETAVLFINIRRKNTIPTLQALK